MNRAWRQVVLILMCLSITSKAYASKRDLNAGPVSQLWEVEINNRSIYCGGPIISKYYSGQPYLVNGEVIFETAKSALTKLSAQIKQASEPKKSKLSAKRTRLARRIREDDLICSVPPGGPVPTIPKKHPIRTPTPGATPISTPSAPVTPHPSPTPTAVPPQQTPTAFFDGSGNMTTEGKNYLKVPSNLTANIFAGMNVWNGSCAACHGSEPLERTFISYKTRTMAPPMNLSKTDQEYADLTAYLNRFR